MIQRGRFAIASVSRGGKGRCTPHLFSLASLRIRYGGGFTFATSSALGLVRSLCRGGIAACPHISAAFLDSSVCPGIPGALGNLISCVSLATSLLGTGVQGSGHMFSGSGIASRRTVVPANMPTHGLASGRQGICSLIIHHFVTTFCPSYRVSAAAMLNGISGMSFGMANGRVLGPK